MSTPSYRLIYFNLRVLGEPIRFLFNYIGVPFEDVRIDRDKEWAALKPSTGWGKLPILEIDGKQQICQSHAIAKYLARKYNLDGANELESAKCDEYVGAANDLRLEWRRFWFEQDQTKKQQMKEEFRDIIAPSYLTKYSKALEENGGKYLVGSGLTWTDFFLPVFFELFEDTIDKNILDPYPILKEYKANIFSIPQVKKSIENRPPYKI
ncbi:Glutathione S-transferase [Orchesella cincta]|uniref:glutathione transferase n=1 Tax=Orchesella cincta TaxID=48709 RepID=A0A1D2N437_ORCCI|nr:Glutathione S-transferase [Orchesella cincta]